jgi:hypothetical protein
MKQKASSKYLRKPLEQACPDLVSLRANIKKFNKYSI